MLLLLANIPVAAIVCFLAWLGVGAMVNHPVLAWVLVGGALAIGMFGTYSYTTNGGLSRDRMTP